MMSGHNGNGLVQKPEVTNDASQATHSDEWDESKLAALLRFDESSETPEAMGSEREYFVDCESTPTLSPEANTVSQAELFDNPIQGKTKPSFSKNPFAKLGGVGLPLLLLFGGGGVFLSGVMGSHKKPAPKLATSPSATPMPTMAVTPATETGNLKTQVALGTQADQIKSLEKSKSPRTPTQKAKSQQKASQPPASSPPRTVPAASGQSSAVRYSPVRYSSSQSSAPQSSAPQSSAPAFSPRKASSSALSARPQPVALAPSPTKSVDPKPQAPSQKTTIDPMQQWMALSQLGSYGRSEARKAGGAGEAEEAEEAGGEKVSSLNTNRDETSAAEPSSVPEQEPSQENAIAASAPTQVEGRFNAQVNPVEEASLLNGVPRRALQVGSMAQGQLVTPVIWAPKAATVTVTPQARPEAQKFVIQLTEPLSDKDGFVALPQGTQLVAQVVDVNASGLAQLQVTQAVVDGQEYMLPPSAISIHGNEGQPLVASKWGNKRPLIASGDITSFLFGALSKVGQVLTQQDSQTSTSISGNGISSSTSSQSGGHNLLGAVLNGGFTPLTQHIKERSEQRMQELVSRPNVWYVPAGESVQVFINQSFEF